MIQSKEFLVSRTDKQLCQSWTVISEDLVSGNNQQREDLWKNISDHFNQHLPDGGSDRQPDVLSLRFVRSAIKLPNLLERLQL
jgi:hypothetical protein